MSEKTSVVYCSECERNYVRPLIQEMTEEEKEIESNQNEAIDKILNSGKSDEEITQLLDKLEFPNDNIMLVYNWQNEFRKCNDRAVSIDESDKKSEAMFDENNHFYYAKITLRRENNFLSYPQNIFKPLSFQTFLGNDEVQMPVYNLDNLLNTTYIVGEAVCAVVDFNHPDNIKIDSVVLYGKAAG